MKTIISPSELLGYIFASGENYNYSMVMEVDIAIAESRYLIPIVGETIYTKLLNGGYYDLRVDYVAPMLSAWIRYMVEPLLAERCGINHGTTAVDDRLLARLRMMAMEQSRRLSHYLDTHAEEYPEYNPIDNPLNHCSIDGNIVQIY